MEVHFPPGQEERFTLVALHTGRGDAEQLVRLHILRLLEHDSRFLAAVEKGIEQADRGEFIEHEDMKVCIEQMLKS